MSPKLKTFAPELTPPTEIGLSDNSRQVLHKRYLRRGLDGKPAETIEGMFRRVARAVAEPDGSYGYDAATTEESFYALLTSLRFFPNSPTFTGAGTPLGQLAACFVLPISDDMGRQSDGIFQTLRDAALIQQTGGGNGFSFSRLRPKGDSVASSAGVATGPVGFLQVYDIAFGEVAQGGCLTPDTLVFTAKGLLRLDEIVDSGQPGWQKHSLEVATDEGWRASPQGYNNGVAPVLRVHTQQGLSLAGTPEHRVRILTDNGPEFTSNALSEWTYQQGIRHRFIDPGKPIQNSHIESFNGKLRDEFLNEHWFGSLDELQKKLDLWRHEYNYVRPHSALGNLVPHAYRQKLEQMNTEIAG